VHWPYVRHTASYEAAVRRLTSALLGSLVGAPGTGAYRPQMDHDANTHIEACLRGGRARPSAGFTNELEEQLLGAPRREPGRRPVFVGALAVAGMTFAVLTLGLVGAGPVAPGGETPGEAGSDCPDSAAKRVLFPVVDVERGQPVVRLHEVVAQRDAGRCD
jgi:hypothetical protein